VWPQNDEVAFVWQKDLSDIGRFLDQNPAITAATVVGWTPDTMDEPTLRVTLRRHDVGLRFSGRVGAVTTAVLPGNESTGSVLLRPRILPFDESLAQALRRQGLRTEEINGIVVYRWPEPFEPQPEIVQTAVFADQLALWGFDQVSDCGQIALPSCDLITYWQVVGETDEPRRIFLHMIDDQGEVIAQSDVLDAPARFWRVGDWLIQSHTLPTTAASFTIELGVYDPRAPFVRLPTAAGETAVLLK
jgi:hypothetical protein